MISSLFWLRTFIHHEFFAKARVKLGPLRSGAIAVFVLAFVCATASDSRADTVVSHIKTMRDYDLVEIDGKTPTRPLRFYIGENSAFAICGHCLCATGVMKGRYPKLRIRPTSASPACSWGSRGIEADSPMVEKFLSMKQISSEERSLIFVDGKGGEMRFELGGANLSPP